MFSAQMTLLKGLTLILPKILDQHDILRSLLHELELKYH